MDYAIAFEGGDQDLSWGTPAILLNNSKTVLNTITKSTISHDEALQLIQDKYLTKLPFEVPINLNPYPSLFCCLFRGEDALFVRGNASPIATKTVKDCTIDLFTCKDFEIYTKQRSNEMFEILKSDFRKSYLDKALTLRCHDPKLNALKVFHAKNDLDWVYKLSKAIVTGVMSKDPNSDLDVFNTTLKDLRLKSTTHEQAHGLEEKKV